MLEILYEKMCCNNLVVQFYAILAFTKLLDYSDALDQARPHFQNILQIYVKMLDIVDHDELLKSLEEVVKIFSN